MSSRTKVQFGASGVSGRNYVELGKDKTRELFNRTLAGGLSGFCISPYEEGQQPGDHLTEEQVRRRLNIIQPHCKWVRSFSCTEGNELVPKIAKELGMKTMVGAWLGDDPEKNKVEIAGLIRVAKEGLVDIAAVGNEVLYRGDMELSDLLATIKHVQDELPDVTVGYVDAYYEFTDHPELVDASDVVLANCYPYWEGCPFEHSLVYMKQMYQQAVDAARGKKVIITETGWPSQGTPTKGSVPSEENAMGYFINAVEWTEEKGIDLFYFSSFDESWKVGAEGDVGAYWGVWDKDENIKYQE
ncbi:glycoside hydrolase family 17 protein [Neolewinella antarctica]|uniref:Endo-1,3-beta-glucanase btgC n=1 Tax=Neolewinella antarctica TaxID=442734 RepID=A0ABX0XBF5_9BACT|nr:glycosyl hydrolase family 17 protein [Neolewinella antarctica]NJC26263.1 exo-beta-1,3-glucanase (GH17 family) [Neolewinella antarctica]